MQIVNAQVMSELCRGCGDCVEICMYNAPKLQDMGNGVFISKIDEHICKGCGACVSICPSSAIKLNHISDEQIRRLTDEILSEHDIMGFVCHWSSQATCDVEEIEGLKMIRVLCSSRINPTLIVHAFEQGAKGVLGIGCDDSACHYNAVKSTTEHYKTAKNIIKTLGLDPKRIKFERTSPDQPTKINRIVRSFCKTIEGLKL
jgi:coenzyme F420-reducing hydrogenase delta subunit/NAD-dependent dihydropyrimidine dehydrogenase PreA subunit